MNTKNKPLKYFKLIYSRNGTGTTFKHTHVDKLPSLSYRFAEGDNWKATDYRVSTRWDDVIKWHENYWETRSTPTSYVNEGLYNKELEKVVTEAIRELNERWTVKLEREFEEAFDDKLLGFLSGEKQNK